MAQVGTAANSAGVCGVRSIHFWVADLDGAPDDWKPVPGRMDLWGAAPLPSPDMVKAEQSVEFSSASL